MFDYTIIILGGDSMYLRRKASPNYKTISQGKKEHGITVEEV